MSEHPFSGPFSGPCPTPFNLTDYVLSAGRATPSKVALTMVGPSGADKWTYEQLEAAVLGTATGLLEAGLEPGDRVLLRLGNDVAFPVAYLAAIAMGALPVPTSAGLTEPEIEKVAAALRPRLVLAGPGIAVPAGVPVLKADALRALAERPPARPVMGDPNRPAYIVLTSGTSGRPRLVVHAHRAIWARRFMWDGWYGLTRDDRMAHAGAFNWTYTLGTGLLDPWAIGATALIPEPGVAPAELPDLLKDHDATIFAAAPGVYRQMLRDVDRLDLPRLRHGLTAGEKCPESIREHWQQTTGTGLHEAFGQSEVSTFISGSPARPAPPGSLGFAQPGRRVAIVDVEGREVAGEPGTIAVHRDDPGLMLELWEDPAGTAERLKGNWYLTGDSGMAGEDGAITYLGRDDDLLNAGGFRVSPLEVEEALSAHPQVTEAAAFELQVKADARVIALCYGGEGEIDEAELRAQAEALLAPYKRPRAYFYRPHLPRGANGKLLRRTLRQAYRGTHGET